MALAAWAGLCRMALVLIFFSSLAVILTTWHMLFATLVTQVLARTTSILDGRKDVRMTGRIYLRAIVPIGFFYSMSLVCSNLTYMYLSVAFIQMLKVSYISLALFFPRAAKLVFS
jgi:hypothetical protein